LGKKFNEEVATGKKHEDVIKSMIMDSCENKPKVKITDNLLKWISMNNLHISDFDTMCDKISERYEQQYGTAKEGTQNSSETTIPLWVIITASIGSTIFMIAVITLIVIYYKKKQQLPNEGAYTQMNE